MALVVEPGVHGERSFEAVEAAECLREQAERRLEEVALEGAPRSVLPRREQELVGQAAAVGGEQDEAVALQDQALAGLDLGVDVSADATLAVAVLGGQGRRRFLQPGELGVAVREARARLAALVQQRVDVTEPGVARGARAFAPGDGDAANLVPVELREGTNVARCRDDDLVVLEDGVEVRDDADRPARRVRGAASRADREGLRRCSLLTALAERAGQQLVLGRQVEIGTRRGAGSPGSVRCDDDP
jgi:hypothetical protein